MTAADTPSRTDNLLALADLMDRASDVFLKGLVEQPAAFAPLSADSINLIVDSLRLAAKPADDGERADWKKKINLIRSALDHAALAGVRAPGQVTQALWEIEQTLSRPAADGVRERIITTCANIANRYRPNDTARSIELEIRALSTKARP